MSGLAAGRQGVIGVDDALDAGDQALQGGAGELVGAEPSTGSILMPSAPSLASSRPQYSPSSSAVAMARIPPQHARPGQIAKRVLCHASLSSPFGPVEHDSAGQTLRPTQTLAFRRARGAFHLTGLVTFGIRIIADQHGATDRLVYIERLISLVSEQDFVFAAPPTWYRPCDARFGRIDAAPGIESGQARAVPLPDCEKKPNGEDGRHG